MTSQSQAGKIQTVAGTISPDQLGVTMTHEHLLSDMSVVYPPPAEASAKGFWSQPVSLETIGYLTYYGSPRGAGRNLHDAMFLDVPTAIEEVMLYKQYGGNSIVDATSISLGRDPVGLARISRATGINVVMGGSYYLDESLPPDMGSRSEDDLVEQFVRDITEGANGTGIKSGIIGEVGCSWPLTENERKVLRASGRAQRLTGAPLLIHPGFYEESPLEIVEALRDVGTDIDRTIIAHIERAISQRSVLKELAETGCYIEWDLLGKEQSFWSRFTPNDATRMDTIAWLRACE